MRILMIGLLAALFLVEPPPAPESSCDAALCMFADGERVGSFKSGSTLNKSARRKQYKNNKRRKDVEVRVVVVGSRGTSFIDGRYVPPAGLAIKPGKHEIEVRDGPTVLAHGVIGVPRKLESIVVQVEAEG